MTEQVVALSINIDVADLELAIEFYETAFGLSLCRRLRPASAELSGAAVPIFLLENPAATPPFAGAALGRDYGRHWTPVHLDFIVHDIDEALRRAKASGARREGAVQTHAWGQLVRLSDPFGNGVCLVQPSARGYAEIAVE